jgi:hypothetical protein
MNIDYIHELTTNIKYMLNAIQHFLKKYILALWKLLSG